MERERGMQLWRERRTVPHSAVEVGKRSGSQGRGLRMLESHPKLLDFGL